MSRVFLAEETRFKRRVVIKVLSPELSAGLSAERFEREIGLAAGLQHANIVPVITAGDVDGLPWYSMPYVDGESLRARLVRCHPEQREGSASVVVVPLSLAETVRILADIARSLAYAHERGIVHRDIKPENILLSGGAAVVTDFGIAKAVSASKTKAPGGTLTQIGTSLGTPAYMAPEQASGDDVDQRADIYAWGVIAYEMLGGRHPFADKTTAQQLIAAHIAEKPGTLTSSTTSAVPRELAALVMRALEKEPARRPASAKELLDVLEGMRTGERAVFPASSRTRWLVALTAVAVMAAVAVFAFTRPRRTQVDTAPSIAVIPFENRGPADQVYFTDGLSDAITGKLVSVKQLTVIDRRSASLYKGSTKSPAQIGNELGVAYLLEGVVSWAKDSVGKWRAQVSPTLIRTKDGGTQWSGEPLVVTPTDPFTAQSEIAAKVVDALGVALQSGERASMALVPTKNPEAYGLYLQALARTREDASNLTDAKAQMNDAAHLLTEATRLDPSFALAYATLGRVEYSRSTYDSTAVAREQEALRTALAIDPNQPEAHYIKSVGLWFRESRLTDALVEAARASTAKPGDAEILGMLGSYQIHAGQIDDGFEKVERAIVLDPRSQQANVVAVYFSFGFRRTDALERHARRWTAISPSTWAGYDFLARAALQRGDTLAAKQRLDEGARATKTALTDPVTFWFLPVSMTFATSATSASPEPALAKGTTLAHLVMRAAWARETNQSARARATFDSAHTLLARRENALQPRSIEVVWAAGTQAMALAGTGRAAEARRMIAFADSVERARALPNNIEMAEGQDYLAYAQLLLGDRTGAIKRLERLLALPSGRTAAMLRTMWPYASLRSDPQFRKIAEMTP